MKTGFIVLALVAFVSTAALAARASSHGTVVRFSGGIGVLPTTNGTPSDNVVRGVPPGTIPWVIRSLQASVNREGHIRVRGRGLLLAGVDSIGTSGPPTVQAELFCGAADQTATGFTTADVPLEADGDFDIRDVLTGVPAVCDNPVLLIGHVFDTFRWFAAGIPVQEE